MSDNLSQIAAPLLLWFGEHKRELPWRQDGTPYHVWISEIMLQQTRIEAVKKYYARFTEALPDVQSLSEADDDALLKLWEGLGYYSRARNLKKAAVKIMSDFGGEFPRCYKDLLTLPGVGEYTAGAIASICFNEKIPAVDGNVLRVISRITGSRDNVLLPETKQKVTAALQKSMPDEAGAFNEGLMELGEIVCLPNGTPDCAHCPLQTLCVACQNGLTEELPVRIKAMKRRQVKLSVFYLTAPDGRVAIEKRGAKGLLSGMYQLPNAEGYFSKKELSSILCQWGLQPLSLSFHKEAKHVFTHIDWLMKSYQAEVAAAEGDFLWVTPEELSATYPLPTAFQKLL